jgi:mRNA interferase MazF
MSALPLRAEVWWAEAPEVPPRPVVVLSRDAVVRGLRRALVSPCTTTVRHLPSEVGLDPEHDPVPRSCVAALDAVESVAVGTLTQRLGRLSDQRMREVCAALAVSTGCA